MVTTFANYTGGNPCVTCWHSILRSDWLWVLFVGVFDGNHLFYRTKALLLYLFVLLCSMKWLVIAPVQLVRMRLISFWRLASWELGLVELPKPKMTWKLFELFLMKKLIRKTKKTKTNIKNKTKQTTKKTANQGIKASLIFACLLFLGKCDHGPNELLLRLAYYGHILSKVPKAHICVDSRKEPRRTSKASDLNHQPPGTHLSCL